MPFGNQQCPECKRLIPVVKKRWVRHYIQDKGWCNSDGERDVCSMSKRLFKDERDDENYTEADYQTWMRL